MLNEVAILGLATGTVEIALSLLAYRYYKVLKEDWLKLFSIGVLILAISHIICKFWGHGIMGYPKSYALGVPFKTIGLLIVIYSVLKGVRFRKADLVTLIVTPIALFFWFGTWYALIILDTPKTLFFTLGHLLYLLGTTWFVALLLLREYKVSGDPSALAFSLGFFVYGLATFINMITVAMGVTMSMTAMSSIALITRATGVAIMLLGFLLVELLT
jgi:xanthine/uracil permease